MSNRFPGFAVFTLLVTTLLVSACTAGSPVLEVGSPAPDFSLPTADGGTVSLADYTGKQPILLYFHMAEG